MAKVYDVESGEVIGTVTATELQFLIDQLEEEDSEDQDYYVDLASLAWFEEQGADAALMALLRQALGEREGMDIRWERD
ncbi:MAG: galactosyldiacylglycerol synthase [Anaerolineae bacterium]|jgi:processive 1,2-diacylglycerol beta-glucosyltransferase